MTRSAWTLFLIVEALGMLNPKHRLPLRIVRTRASKQQRARGEWSFRLVDAEDQVVAASWYSVKEVIAAHKQGLVERRSYEGTPMLNVIYPERR